MKPTQVRSRVLDDHARLRWMLDEIESLTQRFEANFKQFESYVGDDVKEAGVHAA